MGKGKVIVEGVLSSGRLATLKFCWTHVTKHRMAALIAKAFNVLKDALLRCCTRSVGLVVDQPDLEGGPDALYQGIVVKATGAAHAELDLSDSELSLIVVAGVLPVTIRMSQQTRLMRLHGISERAFGQFSYQCCSHCPTNYFL